MHLTDWERGSFCHGMSEVCSAGLVVRVRDVGGQWMIGKAPKRLPRRCWGSLQQGTGHNSQSGVTACW
jgi:hypothetical protein